MFSGGQNEHVKCQGKVHGKDVHCFEQNNASLAPFARGSGVAPSCDKAIKRCCHEQQLLKEEAGDKHGTAFVGKGRRPLMLTLKVSGFLKRRSRPGFLQ